MHEEPAVKAAQPTSVAEGIVKSVTCHDRAFSITLDRSGEALTFHSEQLPALGFTDTLWVGEDHFSPCFHVNGLHAVVHYKPSTNQSSTGDLVTVGFRDDLRISPKSISADAGKKP